MPEMTEEKAVELVKSWIRRQGYEGEIVVLEVQRRHVSYFDVFLLRPYGLFIVKPDLSVEDNYQVFVK